jgi:polynucleotide 5'-kinase involved in rRNA processing
LGNQKTAKKSEGHANQRKSAKRSEKEQERERQKRARKRAGKTARRIVERTCQVDILWFHVHITSLVHGRVQFSEPRLHLCEVKHTAEA